MWWPWLRSLIGSWLRPATGPAPPIPQLPGSEADILADINRHRQEHGLVPLRAHRGLDAQAVEWAAQMAARGRLGHEGWQQRLLAAGFSRGSENVYWSSWPASADDVARAWLDSPGHRRNVLGSDWAWCGVGVTIDPAGASWVCCLFAEARE